MKWIMKFAADIMFWLFALLTLAVAASALPSLMMPLIGIALGFGAVAALMLLWRR